MSKIYLMENNFIIFKKINLIIRDEFFQCNFYEFLQRERLIMSFLGEYNPLMYFYNSSQSALNAKIYEFIDVPYKYFIETIKYIEASNELQNFISVLIIY